MSKLKNFITIYYIFCIVYFWLITYEVYGEISSVVQSNKGLNGMNGYFTLSKAFLFEVSFLN